MPFEIEAFRVELKLLDGSCGTVPEDVSPTNHRIHRGIRTKLKPFGSMFT